MMLSILELRHELHRQIDGYDHQIYLSLIRYRLTFPMIVSCDINT